MQSPLLIHEHPDCGCDRKPADFGVASGRVKRRCCSHCGTFSYASQPTSCQIRDGSSPGYRTSLTMSGNPCRLRRSTQTGKVGNDIESHPFPQLRVRTFFPRIVKTQRCGNHQTQYTDNRPVVPHKWSLERDGVFAFEYPSVRSGHEDVEVERQTE